jgi:transposase
MRRTSNDIFRHLEEMTLENERLKEENSRLRKEIRELKTENARLHKRIETLESVTESRIAKAVEEAVAKATEPLLAIIAEKDKEILRLKSQINKDSSTSSQPPGSSGFKKIPNNREKSSKKQGGQYGHRGARLNIPENLKELVEAGVAEHVILSEVEEGEPYVSDWTVDIKVVTVFTEHRRKPGNPPKIEYGMQLKVLAVYLCIMGLIAYKRLSEFFREISKGLITVSKGTLAEFNRIAAEKINLEPNVQDLLNGEVISVDDTQIKTSERPCSDGTPETSKNTTFSAYIRTYSNEKTTVLTAHPGKSEETVNTDNILTQFHGIVSQDHESKFYNFGNENATCCAHLTRELKGMAQLQMLEWANGVRSFFLEMNEHKLEDIRDGKASCGSDLLRLFEEQYDKYVIAGRLQLDSMPPKSFGYDELRRMVNRLEKHKDNYMLFMRNYKAPFTNNQAERDLRHCKTRQKVSGCFRSWQGVLDYCKIRSFLSTAKKRGQNLVDSLSAAFTNYAPAGQ